MYALAVLKLAAQTPEMARPTNSSHSTGASAITMKSMPRPRLEMRMTVRRPKRSESAPWIGEQTNCISMNSVPKPLDHTAALAMLPPISSTIRCGSTGMMMPNASMSIITVTKTNRIAARRRGRSGDARSVIDGGRRAGGRSGEVGLCLYRIPGVPWRMACLAETSQRLVLFAEREPAPGRLDGQLGADVRIAQQPLRGARVSAHTRIVAGQRAAQNRHDRLFPDGNER